MATVKANSSRLLSQRPTGPRDSSVSMAPHSRPARLARPALAASRARSASAKIVSCRSSHSRQRRRASRARRPASSLLPSSSATSAMSMNACACIHVKPTSSDRAAPSSHSSRARSRFPLRCSIQPSFDTASATSFGFGLRSQISRHSSSSLRARSRSGSLSAIAATERRWRTMATPGSSPSS